MRFNLFALAAAGAVSLLASSPAGAGQIWYTVTGTSDVSITGFPGYSLSISNVAIRYSVVGDTSNYFDDSPGVRLITATSPIATVTASGTGTVVPFGSHFPVSLSDYKLPVAGPGPGEEGVFADGFGAYDGKFAFGTVSGSSVDLGATFGGDGLIGWDGISALATTSVSLLDGQPALDLSNGKTWNLLNLHDLTFTATVAGASADTPLLAIGDTTPSDGYTFNFSATGGRPVYVDPFVAAGYDYVLGDGSPLITSAIFPVIGSSHYSIYALGDLSTPLFSDVAGGQTVDFTTLPGYAGGINGFSLRGVDVHAGLDPNDGTAFVTGLTFTDEREVSLTQIPISVSVPEPSAWALMLLGFGGLGAVLRRRGRALAA